MNTNMNFDANGNFIETKAVSRDSAKTFVAQVFSWMFGALLVTAALAYVFANSSLITMMINPETFRPTPFYWIAAFSPIIIIFAMGAGVERFSMGVMVGLFALYSALMGVSLSVIFLVFDPIMIVKAFGLTAGTFGIMAVLGYTTKADLSRFGTIMMMGVVGIVIASIINYFMDSSQLAWIIDIVCLVVFTGLVAFKMQVIRQYGETYGTSQPKMAVFMALTLYITFINLFLTILRLMGNRR